MPPDPWSGEFDATQAGPSAPQLSVPAFSWINAAAGRLDEDCLSLNVWTPATDGRKRPVMVWIHGGGFLVGSGSTPVYDGADLAERGDVVVVTINYRLGAIGFAHLATVFPEELPHSSNLGLRDQIAALEWVRDHIDRFGGDPGNVTVFGQSAGGMSVGALLGAPRARKLFHRAICMSGAADHVLSGAEAHVVAEKLLHELGGPSPNPVVLGRIPLEQILAAQNRTMASLADLRSLMVFLPCVDRDLIPEQPIDQIRAGATAHIPILTGATLEEWKLFGLLDGGMAPFDQERLVARFSEVLPDLPHAPSAPTAAKRFREALGERTAAHREKWTWHAFQSSRVFHYPSTRLADAQHEGGGTAHSYLMTWRAPLARRALGSCHAIDIPFVFGNTQHPLARPLTGLRREAGRLSRRMQHSWIEFARQGSPGHDRLPEWPIYTPDDRQTMVFGRRSEVSEAPLEAERALLARWGRD
jgi:para-nitrobenzyl esterase